MLSLNDFLNIIVKGVHSKSAKLCKEYGCSPSGPVDLSVFNEFSLFMSISQVIFMLESALPENTLFWTGTPSDSS